MALIADVTATKARQLPRPAAPAATAALLGPGATDRSTGRLAVTSPALPNAAALFGPGECSPPPVAENARGLCRQYEKTTRTTRSSQCAMDVEPPGHLRSRVGNTARAANQGD